MTPPPIFSPMPLSIGGEGIGGINPQARPLPCVGGGRGGTVLFRRATYNPSVMTRNLLSIISIERKQEEHRLL